MKSLRWRLLLFLSAAILIASAAQFVVSFRAAMQEANALFDYHMEQMALALQDSGAIEQEDWQEAVAGPGPQFDFIIQIWSADGVRIYKSRNFRAIPNQAELGYSNVVLDNGEWRIYAVRNGERVIQVGQRMDVRRERAVSLALQSLWLRAATALLLCLVAAWWVVTKALAPLNRIGAELAARNAESLTPISGEGVPREVSRLVHELNSLLARMDAALAAQQRFVADAAHELRSPLTALKLQVQTLERARNEEARAQGIARLRGGVDRAVRLLEQLLTLARQDPLAADVQTQPVSLRECVEQVAVDIAPLALAKGIEVQYGPWQGGPDLVEADADSLRMMIRNLLDNAVRYTPAGGEVRVTVAGRDGQVVLLVEDNGPGIAEQDRARVFDRFYRVPGTSANGSGLGLAIVKAIAQRYGATLVLRSASIGGLAIDIGFPAAAGAALAPAKTAA